MDAPSVGQDGYIALLCLAAIFFPGIIGSFLLNRLLFYKDKSSFHFILHSFVIGVIAYFFAPLTTFQLEERFFQINPPSFSFFFDLAQGNILPQRYNIISATLWSVIIVFAFAYSEKKNWILRIAYCLRASDKFLEPDVWGYAFNSDIINNNDWLIIRNKKHNLMYKGRLLSFSDSYREAEILISDVTVFTNKEAVELYTVPYVYLTLEPSDLEIELFDRASKTY